MKRSMFMRPWVQKVLGLTPGKHEVSDYTLHILEACSERLEQDAALREAVTAFNKVPSYSWFQSTVLHMWLCLGRMYNPPMEHRELMAQEMSDQLFFKVEDQLIMAGITNPIAFGREYKRLAQIFNGTCVAYDKAYTAQDEEALSRALWRNLLNQDPDKWSPKAAQLPLLVNYVKRQKVILNAVSAEEFGRGVVPFTLFAEPPPAAKSKD